MKAEKANLEDFEKSIFGYEKIIIEIPKETHALVVTTVCDIRNGQYCIHSNTYGDKEIKELKEMLE